MRVKITPSQIAGTLSIPASKSMAHRAIICASLAQGTSKVTNVTFSKDIEATIACMEALGAKIEVEGNTCIVTGCDVKKVNHPLSIDCNESGSTLRFLVPICALSQEKVSLQGHGRLLQRPMDVYKDIFAQQGLSFKQGETLQIQGPIHSQNFVIRGDISSQFITGLMFALPLLDKDSTLEILPPFESKSYVNLTLQMLEAFGIQIIEEDALHYTIPGKQTYQAKDVRVEGDYSQLAFFSVLASLQNSLCLKNMDMHSRQGDRVILDFLKKAGSQIHQDQETITISSRTLSSQTMDIADCPDLGPILCVLASFTPGCTKLIHAQRLRMKESDRIAAMEAELKKWDVNVTSTFDTITIQGKPEYTKENVMIDGHNDHRIVMAMTVFGLCASQPCIIEDAQAISKSYPNFFKDVQKIGGKVEIL